MLSVFTLVIPDGATSRASSSSAAYSSSPESRSASLGSGTESSARRWPKHKTNGEHLALLDHLGTSSIDNASRNHIQPPLTTPLIEG
jgi:hypothetical protein